VVLKDELSYYEDKAHYEESKDPKGVVALDSFMCQIKDGSNPENQFSIFAVPKSLVCRADNEDDMKSWVQAISSLSVPACAP